MRKIATIIAAISAILILAGGIAGAAPVDRNSGAAEHSDCRTVTSSASRWVIEVLRTDVDEETGEVNTYWATRYVRELPEEGVFRIVREPRVIHQNMCQYV